MDVMIEKIMSMLTDMDEEQLHNVYDYVCNEHNEKNHETNLVEELKKQIEISHTYKMW